MSRVSITIDLATQAEVSKLAALAAVLTGSGAVVAAPERLLVSANDEIAVLRRSLAEEQADSAKLREKLGREETENAELRARLETLTVNHFKNSTAPAPATAPPTLQPETGAVDVVSDPCRGCPRIDDGDLDECGEPAVETVGGMRFCAACAVRERAIIAEDEVDVRESEEPAAAAPRSGAVDPAESVQSPAAVSTPTMPAERSALSATQEDLEKPAGVASAVQSSECPATSPGDRIPAGTGDVVDLPASARRAEQEEDKAPSPGSVEAAAEPGAVSPSAAPARAQAVVCASCLAGDCDTCDVLRTYRSDDCACPRCGVEAQIAEAAGKKAKATPGAIPDEAYALRVFRIRGGRLDCGEVAFSGTLEAAKKLAEEWRSGTRALRDSTLEYLGAREPGEQRSAADETMSLDAPEPEQAPKVRWGAVAGPHASWHLWAGPDVAEAECGEAGEEPVTFRHEVPEDGLESVCLDCLALDVPAAIAWREKLPATTPCLVPGCGLQGQMSDSAPGVWCAAHEERIPPLEKRAIAERTARLVAEDGRLASQPELDLPPPARREVRRRCSGINKAAGVPCAAEAKEGSEFCGRHGRGARAKKPAAQPASEVAGG